MIHGNPYYAPRGSYITYGPGSLLTHGPGSLITHGPPSGVGYFNNSAVNQDHV